MYEENYLKTVLRVAGIVALVLAIHYGVWIIMKRVVGRDASIDKNSICDIISECFDQVKSDIQLLKEREANDKRDERTN